MGDPVDHALVYRDDGSGTWTSVNQFNGLGDNDGFGTSVAVDGDYIVIGEPHARDTDWAHFYHRDGNGFWQGDGRVSPSDSPPTFGRSVALRGETAVIGADQDNYDGFDDAGSAYIFQRDNSGVWTEVAKLTPSDPAEEARFGQAVAFDGENIVVGAPVWWRSDRPGSAYIFRQDESGEWQEVAKLTPEIRQNGDFFGASVAISGNVVLIGAYGEDGNGTNLGAAYLFRENGSGQWDQIARLSAPDGEDGDGFGFGVASDGRIAVIGALGDDDARDAAGAAYVFDLACQASLNNLSVITGTLLDGGLPEVEFSDDSYVHTRSGFGPSFIDLHNMEMRISAVTTVDSPATLDITIESRIDQPAGRAEIQLFNHNTQGFDPVGQFALGNTDAIDTIFNINATNFVSAQGDIEMSIQHLVFVPFLAFTFESFIDWVEIVVR